MVQVTNSSDRYANLAGKLNSQIWEHSLLRHSIIFSSWTIFYQNKKKIDLKNLNKQKPDQNLLPLNVTMNDNYKNPYIVTIKITLWRRRECSHICKLSFPAKLAYLSELYGIGRLHHFIYIASLPMCVSYL